MRVSLKTHDRIEPNLDLNAHSSYPETGKFDFKISNALHEYDLFYPFLIKCASEESRLKKHEVSFILFTETCYWNLS